MDHLSAEAAVLAARARLREQGAGGEDGWHHVVVPAPDPDGGWRVRTWTATLSDPSRPDGPPDHVHHVWSDPHRGRSLRVEQVFPVRTDPQQAGARDGAPRRNGVSRHLDYFGPATIPDPPPWPAREELTADGDERGAR